MNKGRGIYAVARVSRTAYPHWFNEAEIERFKKYYANWRLATKDSQWCVDFTVPDRTWNRVSNPLLADSVSWEQSLPRVLKQFVQPGAGAGTKAFELSPDEGETLWHLVFH